MRELGQRLREQGVTSVEERPMHGHPVDVILDLAKGTPNSLVAMTTHGRTGMARLALGSVTDRVVTSSSRPVLVIRVTKGLIQEV